jgi:hypothetical protein
MEFESEVYLHWEMLLAGVPPPPFAEPVQREHTSRDHKKMRYHLP